MNVNDTTSEYPLYRAFAGRLRSDASKRKLHVAQGKALLSTARAEIEKGGYGQWSPLAPRTVYEKRRLGMDYGPLIRTGRLIGSLVPGGADNIFDATEDHVEVGTDVPYAAPHQTGAPKRNLPARPFMVWNENTEAMMVEIARRWGAGDL